MKNIIAAKGVACYKLRMKIADIVWRMTPSPTYVYEAVASNGWASGAMW